MTGAPDRSAPDGDAPPLVTVLVPAYRQERLIGQTLDSILAQTYPNIEIIVGDDASPDGTAAVVSAYAERFPGKVRLVTSPRNLGITGNCRRLAPLIRGRYVCWFAGDDVMRPQKIAMQVAALEAHPEAVLCYHDCEVFDDGSGRLLYRFNGAGGLPAYNGDILKPLLLHRSFICGISMMLRTSAMPPDGHDARVPTASDWLLMIEMAARGRAVYLPEPLAGYRRHDGNVTARPPSFADEEETFRIVAADRPHLGPLVDRGLARMYLFYAVKYAIRGDLAGASGALRRLGGVVARRPSVVPSLLLGVGSEASRRLARLGARFRRAKWRA